MINTLLFIILYFYVIVSIIRCVCLYIEKNDTGSELAFGALLWPILLFIWVFITVPKKIWKIMVYEIKN